MSDFDIRKYISRVNYTDMDKNESANEEIKKIFGPDAYVTQVENSKGKLIYQIYAQYYPDAILSLKSENEDLQVAIDNAKKTINNYKRGVYTDEPVKKKPGRYDEFGESIKRKK